VPANDLAAAQRDVTRLTLRQLLRLRVLHLDFTPSGAGADSGVTGIGGTHEAFLATLDSSLFQRLGEKATNALKGDSLTDAHHRLGRQAVFLVAAAAALPDPVWWVWWITEKRRVYFNADQFSCNCDFPENDSGVLEVTDMSKPDRNATSGVRWFDWRVHAVREEAALSPEPLQQQQSAPLGSAKAPHESLAISTTAQADWSSVASPPRPQSSSGGGFVSQDVLQDIRAGLRKVS